MKVDYTIKAGRVCPGCGYRDTDVNHFRLHVPQKDWPASMRAPRRERVVISGLVYYKDQLPADAEPAWMREPYAFPLPPRSEYEAVSGEEPAPVLATLPDEHGTGVAQSSETAPAFACEQCGRTFTRAAGLGAHRRVHA